MINTNTTIDRVFAAREFAVKAHGDQKYGDEPYVVHLDEVATLCLHHLPGIGVRVPDGDGFSSFVPLIVDCLVAAYLHDVLEDTEKTAADIEAEFGERAVMVAVLLSDPPGKSRRERKAVLHERLAGLDESSPHGAVVLGVKLMDRLANSKRSFNSENESLLSMYKKEAADFRKAVFRQGFYRQAWVEIDRICA